MLCYEPVSYTHLGLSTLLPEQATTCLSGEWQVKTSTTETWTRSNIQKCANRCVFLFMHIINDPKNFILSSKRGENEVFRICHILPPKRPNCYDNTCLLYTSFEAGGDIYCRVTRSGIYVFGSHREESCQFCYEVQTYDQCYPVSYTHLDVYKRQRSH